MKWLRLSFRLQTVTLSRLRSISHSIIYSFRLLSLTFGGRGRSQLAGASRRAGEEASSQQPRCTIPWCASVKTNWYLPDTWDWLSSIKGAAAVVWVSDWMARMRCLHFEFTCLPSLSRSILTALPCPALSPQNIWPLAWIYIQLRARGFIFPSCRPVCDTGERLWRLWLSHSTRRLTERRSPLPDILHPT